MSQSFVLEAIDPSVADELRRQGGPAYVADEQPGFPCRQCLRDADIGDELILVSHDPFATISPYRSASPIFLHRQPCPPHEPSDVIPEQQQVRQLSVRAFDAGEMMVDAALVAGVDLADTIVDLLADSRVERLHVHNATRGCWAVSVRRA